MAKKGGFGKFLVFCTVAGAACAGAYYYLKKQDEKFEDDFDDDLDDFDIFGEDESEAKKDRKYVNLEHNDKQDASGASDDDSIKININTGSDEAAQKADKHTAGAGEEKEKPEKVKISVENAVKEVKKNAESAVKEAKETTESAVKETKESAESAVKEVKETAAPSEVKNALDEAEAAVKDALSETESFFDDTDK